MERTTSRARWFPMLPCLLVVGLSHPALAQALAPEPTPSPSPEPPKIDVTDVQHDAFSLSLAEVAFAKAVTPDSRVGFRTDLDFGKTAALVAAYEPESVEGGFMTLGTKGQSLTIISDHLLAGALKARFEYRTDFTDEPFFANADGDLKKSQTTATVGLVYSFGGKI